MSGKTYKIRTAQIVSTNGSKYPQASVTIPNEIANPLLDAGFTHVTYEVTDRGVLIVPVRIGRNRNDYGDVTALVANLTNGQEG